MKIITIDVGTAHEDRADDLTGSTRCVEDEVSSTPSDLFGVPTMKLVSRKVADPLVESTQVRSRRGWLERGDLEDRLISTFHGKIFAKK